ncbi:MAG: oxidoreductase, partial [Alphaproteobacteria bacterium]|nr:oxidoreductase [Alphaproteobacteria bacterium]
EPDGSRSRRLAALADLLRAAGIGVAVSADIRTDIWLKLLANVSIAPVAALAGASVGETARDEGARHVVRDAMEECKAVARAFGVEIPISTEDRINKTAGFNTHRPSLLQDIERGRPPELDPTLGSVRELGRMAGVETPVIDALYALIRLRAASG